MLLLNVLVMTLHVSSQAGQASCQVYLAEGKHLQSSSLVVCKVSKGECASSLLKSSLVVCFIIA